MYLKHLALTNFRNYTRLEIDLPARIHVLQGENAQGKTNLLESIYYLATTKSPLTSSDQHLVNWAVDHEIIPHANVRGVFVREEEEHIVEYDYDGTIVRRRKSGDNTIPQYLEYPVKDKKTWEKYKDVLEVDSVILLCGNRGKQKKSFII